MYGPGDDSYDSDDGFSDDNEYITFQNFVKKQQLQPLVISEAEQRRDQNRLVYSAIVYRRYEALIDELAKGFDVNTELQNGWTPLLLAAVSADAQTVQELINRGANIEQQHDGSNALLLACGRVAEDDKTVLENILSIVQLLVEKGLDPNSVDRKRRTPIMLAAHKGNIEVVKFLLPLSEKHAEDNQRWTALFWAVEGNNKETVKLLVDEGYACNKIDIRENNVMDIAHYNGFDDILKLFPEDPSNNEYYIYMTNNPFNFEEVFENLEDGEKPQLFTDVCNILYGVKTESTIPIFSSKNIGLLDFLSTTDSELKNIGVQLPYQRNRILTGIYNFHKHSFHPKSIPFVAKNELYSNIDVGSVILSTIKQLIAMEGSVKFMLNNLSEEFSQSEVKDVAASIFKIQKQLLRIKPVMDNFVKKSQQWDSTIKSADKITLKRRNVPWSNLALLSVVVSSGIIIFKLLL